MSLSLQAFHALFLWFSPQGMIQGLPREVEKFEVFLSDSLTEGVTEQREQNIQYDYSYDIPGLKVS